ncbi:MAG: glycosyltransferase family 9 protein [Dehalococcoidia bacterium]
MTAELGRSIAVMRALQLGDLLCAIPALRALKRAEPASEIRLIGLPWAEQLVTRFPGYLAGFLAFPGWPGVAELPFDDERFDVFEDTAAACRFDLAVQMHGSGSTSNGFVAAVPARARAGFVPPDAETPPGFLPYPTDRSEVERLLVLAEHLGATDLDPTLEFPVFAEERVEAQALLAALGVERGAGLACLHPGGRGDDRRWPAADFAAVADVLDAAGYTVAVTGSEIDRPVNDVVRAASRAPLVDLTGRTTIGTLGAIIEGAALVVTNDSAPSHLAAALRVPSVVIYTGSDRSRWEPLDRERHRGVGAGRPDGGPPAPPPPVAEVLAALPIGPGASLSAR